MNDKEILEHMVEVIAEYIRILDIMISNALPESPDEYEAIIAAKSSRQFAQVTLDATQDLLNEY